MDADEPRMLKNRPAIAVAWIVLFGLVIPGLSARNRVERAVVISIDGLVPETYLDPEGSGVDLPVLASLKESGSWAESVLSVYPSQTYPAHTTLVTGTLPDRHGVYSNTMLQADGSESWRFEASAIRVATLWDVAKADGLTTAAVSWPVSVGAAVDYLIPETHQAPPGSNWLDLVRSQSTPGLVDAVVESLGGFGPTENLIPERRDAFVTHAACLILKKFRPHLTLVHLAQADFAQHDFGRGSTQAKEAFRKLDACVGEILTTLQREDLSETTAVVVVGDHGFETIHSLLEPNVLLRQQGFISVGPGGNIADWKAICHRGAVRLRDPRDRQTAQAVEELFQGLAGRRYAGIFRLVGKEELSRLGADPDAEFYLEPAEGYGLSDQVEGPEWMVPATRFGTHGFLPSRRSMYSGMIASGAGVRKGLALPEVRLVDVAPTVARLLGLPMSGADGVPLVALPVLSRVQVRP